MKLDVHNGADGELVKHQTEQLQKRQREYKLIGSQVKVPGHIMFSYNTATGEIKQAKYVRKAQMQFDGTVKFEERINVEKDCIYRQALNKKNVVKHLKPEGFETFNY